MGHLSSSGGLNYYVLPSKNKYNILIWAAFPEQIYSTLQRDSIDVLELLGEHIMILEDVLSS